VIGTTGSEDLAYLERKVEERPQSLREAYEGSGAANGRQGLQTLYNAFDSTSPMQEIRDFFTLITYIYG